jgi:hypothetical protein
MVQEILKVGNTETTTTTTTLTSAPKGRTTPFPSANMSDEDDEDDDGTGPCVGCTEPSPISDKCACGQYIHEWCKPKWYEILTGLNSSLCKNKGLQKRPPPTRSTTPRKAQKAVGDSSPAVSPGKDSGKKGKQRKGKVEEPKVEEVLENNWHENMNEIFISLDGVVTTGITLLMADGGDLAQLPAFLHEHPSINTSLRILCVLSVTGILMSPNLDNFKFSGMVALPHSQTSLVFFLAKHAPQSLHLDLEKLIPEIKGVDPISFIHLPAIRQYKVRELEKQVITKTSFSKEERQHIVSGLSIRWWEAAYEKMAKVKYFFI